MADERVYCAEVCAASNEPMPGTAPQVDVWLLLEYKPSWKRKAIQDNSLSPELSAWLHDTLARLAASGPTAEPLVVRPQFIRRPEIDTNYTTLMLARDNRLWRYETTGYDGIRELDLSAPDTGMTEEAAAQYFVCTNGQRDVCCARFGLPAYARLRELVGERAWQTTHVGGHRFAPNVVVLPQGVLYGRVTPDAATSFVEQVESGKLATAHLRGRSTYPRSAQVAETALTAAQESTLLHASNDSVVFATPSGEHTIDVTPAAQAIEVLPSCGAERESVVPLQTR